MHVHIHVQTTEYCAIRCWTNITSAWGGRSLKLIEGCGQQDVGGMGKWTQRAKLTEGEENRQTQCNTNTHFGSKAFLIFSVKAASHRWCHDLYILTPTTSIYLCFSSPLPAWAWDKNAARHQVLPWQQRTAQARIIWTDAIVNENNKTEENKH